METKRKTFNKIYKGSLLVVFLFIAIISCNKNPYNDNSRLLGTWENKQPTYTETYIYDGITFTSINTYKYGSRKNNLEFGCIWNYLRKIY